MLTDLVMRWRCVAVLLCATLLGPNMALGQTEPYRLVPGDRLKIEYLESEVTLEATVDLDGQIRLADVGGVTVTHLTLDEAENLIETRLTKEALFVNAQANLSIMAYAPIIVTGDVSAPGRHDFMPGMTVSSALAIAGGSVVEGMSNFDLTRMTADLRARLRLVNLEIAALVVRIARLETTLADTPDMTLLPEMRQTIPMPDAVRLETYLASEAAILSNSRSQTDELLAAWEEEIDALSEQQRLLGLRMEAQETLVANAQEAFDNAQSLSARGLQTATALAAAEQSLITARSRVFELEALQITLVRSISEAVRARVQYRRQIQEDALAALNAAQVNLDDALLRFGQTTEQLALLTSGNYAALLDSATVDVTYSVLSPRDGRTTDTGITPQTPLLPGDMLSVKVRLSLPGMPDNSDTRG